MRFKAELEEIYTVMKEKSSIKEIADYITANHNEIELTNGTVKVYLGKIKREHTEVITLDERPAWKVVKDSYIFEVQGDRKVFSIELIDKIFLFYSRRGYNFTRLKCQQRFNMTPKVFNQVQNAFHLSKDCDTISPYTKENTPAYELEQLIERQTAEVLNSGEMGRQKYDEGVIRKYRQVIDKSNVDDSWRQEVVSDLLEKYPNCAEIKVLRDDNNKIQEVTIGIADLHAGGKNDKMKITEDWSLDLLIEKLHNVAIIANSFKAAKVNIVILGDLVETVSGINHPDSWKGIGNGHFGSNIIILTKDILVNHLLNRIVNLNKIIATGGNHDRLQASNKNSDTGATDLIFHMIAERLKLIDSDVEVIYDPVLVSFEADDFGFIGLHGDKGLHKRELSYIVNKFAVNKNQYQFVWSAHLHSFFCKKDDDQEFARRCTISSIVTGNEFSDVQIGRASKSGCISVIKNAVGQPDMTVHNI